MRDKSTFTMLSRREVSALAFVILWSAVGILPVLTSQQTAAAGRLSPVERRDTRMNGCEAFRGAL